MSEKSLSELFETREYYYIWYGACRMAMRIIEFISGIQGDRKLNNTKFIKNTLEFLVKSKYNILNFIISEVGFKVAPVRDAKGKATKEYKPYRMVYENSAGPELYGTEFISEEEHKWRDTARILMKALDNASNTISVMNGRDPGEVFNSLICGKSVERPPECSGNDERLITDIKPMSVRVSKSDIPSGSEPDSCIILDFFAGSSTTAHAVMQLNAEDKGHRKYIMVQSPEICEEGSEARKSGYNTITDIGRERIRRAAKKIAKENSGAEFDGGFQAYRVEPIANDETPFIPDTGVIRRKDYFKAILERAGLTEDAPLEELDVCGARFWSAGGGRVIFADDKGTTVEQVKALIAMRPEHIALFSPDEEVVKIVRSYLNEREQLRVRNTGKKMRCRNEQNS